MKIYSLCFAAFMMGILWASLSLTDLVDNVNSSNLVRKSVSKLTSPKTGWSGNYPANSGYHNYGFYSVDASGISTGNPVTIYFQAYDVPNRFYLTDDCSLGTYSYSGSSSDNYYVGVASYSGPWNFMGGINTSAGGSCSILKAAGCDTYKFQVETSTGSSTADGWAVNL